MKEKFLGTEHSLSWQDAGAAKDPGIVYVEDPHDICAGVDHSHTGIVGGQDPVWAVGSNCDQRQKGKEREGK